MTIAIEATYSNGVLRPNQPLPLAENETVSVTISQQPDAALTERSESAPEETTELTLGEWIATLARDFPPEVLERLPTDGASQHDHYLWDAEAHRPAGVTKEVRRLFRR